MGQSQRKCHIGPEKRSELEYCTRTMPSINILNNVYLELGGLHNILLEGIQMLQIGGQRNCITYGLTWPHYNILTITHSFSQFSQFFPSPFSQTDRRYRHFWQLVQILAIYLMKAVFYHQWAPTTKYSHLIRELDFK